MHILISNKLSEINRRYNKSKISKLITGLMSMASTRYFITIL